MLIALYAVMQFIFAPVLGTLSDRFGRRRVLLVSLAGATVDYLVLATTSALSVFYIARAVAGITGATNAVTATVIADITPPHQRAKRFGLLSACYGGGMIAGPAMGGLFGAISPHLPFLLAALLSASNLALTFILLRETRPDSPARSASLAQHRGRPGLSAVPGIPSINRIRPCSIHWAGSSATWVLFTEHRLDWSPVEVGISLSVFGIVQVLVQALLTGRIVEWIGEAKTVIIGCITDALGLVGLAIVTDAFSMAPILAALGIGGIGLPALQPFSPSASMNSTKGASRVCSPASTASHRSSDRSLSQRSSRSLTSTPTASSGSAPQHSTCPA